LLLDPDFANFHILKGVAENLQDILLSLLTTEHKHKNYRLFAVRHGILLTPRPSKLAKSPVLILIQRHIAKPDLHALATVAL
jgi:hypothetical protein